MSKQRKIQKIIFCILAVILVIIFYEAIGIYTAYKKQPKEIGRASCRERV